MRTQEPILSIALIVYNHEKYLEEAIESILMQNVDFRYEIVVGEDCSTDESRKILERYKLNYPEIFQLVLQAENVGGTRNTYDVFMNCKGRYVTFIEGDDYWIDKNKLQKQFDFLENNDEFVGVSHVIEARDLDGNFVSKHPASKKIVGKYVDTELFLKGYYHANTSTFFKNIFLDKAIDFEICYNSNRDAGDFILCMLILNKGKIKILEDTMAVYRCRKLSTEGNYNSLKNVIFKYSDYIKQINALNEYFEGKYNFLKEYTERTVIALLYSIRYRKINDFNDVFVTIPKNYKIKIYLLLPITTLKIVFSSKYAKQIKIEFKKIFGRLTNLSNE